MTLRLVKIVSENLPLNCEEIFHQSQLEGRFPSLDDFLLLGVPWLSVWNEERIFVLQGSVQTTQ